MDKNEKRISLYSALLISFLVNTPKLLALRENGLVAKYWHFNPTELAFQFFLNLLFCFLFFQLNLNRNPYLVACRSQNRFALYLFWNGLFFFSFVILGGIIQHQLFPNHQLPRVFIFGYLVRFGLSIILTGIIVKIVMLIRKAQLKDVENEQLKTAYMKAELDLLKAQLNPHFLFNSLSSLSGIVRENPSLAQHYIRNLSTVFRYSLQQSTGGLVMLSEELTMLQAFAKLITMRLESAFVLTIDIPESYHFYLLPHLSLQPLLENAIKHNAATISKPLKVSITIVDEKVCISNTLNEIPTPESSNGLGLVNLNERFKILLKQEIEITRNDGLFTVNLPLQP